MRPFIVNDDIFAAMKKMKDNGHTYENIAITFGMHRTTIYRAFSHMIFVKKQQEFAEFDKFQW